MKTIKKVSGTAEPFSLIIIAICICIGGYFALRSQVLDSPAEQTAEAVLRTEGIDVDFSANKKKERDDHLPQVLSSPD